MADETNPIIESRVKIEQPERDEKFGFFYGFLLFLSFILILFTVALLVIEWTQTPFPHFLRIPVGS
jgi:hypothetical protein